MIRSGEACHVVGVSCAGDFHGVVDIMLRQGQNYFRHLAFLIVFAGGLKWEDGTLQPSLVAVAAPLLHRTDLRFSSYGGSTGDFATQLRRSDQLQVRNQQLVAPSNFRCASDMLAQDTRQQCLNCDL